MEQVWIFLKTRYPKVPAVPVSAVALCHAREEASYRSQGSRFGAAVSYLERPLALAAGNPCS